MTKDEMVGWHHRLNGHEFEQTLGDSEGQGSLACCSLGGRLLVADRPAVSIGCPPLGPARGPAHGMAGGTQGQ